MPVRCKPKIIIIIPAITRKRLNLDARKLPITLAPSPNAINTTEKPNIKNTEFKIMKYRFFFSLEVFISSRETPDMNEIYPGISGNIQGEKNEASPAKNALNIETFSKSIIFKEGRRSTKST